MKQRIFRQGMRDGIPICLGYLAVSFSFGILASEADLSALAATVMSATNLTSAGQFAALGVIATGAPLLELAATQLVINLRYSLMSAALSQKLAPGTGTLHRLVMAFGITDEIFGVSSGYTGPAGTPQSEKAYGGLSPWYTYGLMAVAIPGWAGGTLLGAWLGGVLPARLLSALGVALYGMFIAIVLPPAKKSRVLAGVVLAAVVASSLFAVAPVLRQLSAGMRVVLLTVGVSAVAAVLFPVGHAPGGEEAAHGT